MVFQIKRADFSRCRLKFGLLSFIFRIAIKVMASVSKLLCSDNPPDPALPYPGKWGRNNLKGITLSKQEYLDQKTDEWLAYVSSKPSYQVTAMANKARCLKSHLKESFRKVDKNANAECRELIERAEARSKGENMEVDGNGNVEVGEDDGRDG